MSDKYEPSPESDSTEFSRVAEEGYATKAPPPARRAPALAPVLAGGVLVLAALAGAWLQPLPAPSDQESTLFAPGRLDWWRHPLETHPALRLPVIQGKLSGIHALADGKLWVVGEGGLILHSADGGLTWRQQHPEAAAPSETPKPAPRAALLDLISSAHAIDQIQQKYIAPPEQNIEPTQQLNKAAIANQAPIVPVENLPARKIAKPAAPTRVVAKPAPKPVAKPADSKPAVIEPPPEDVDLHTVFFLDAMRGWAAGDQGMVWITRDGGAHWQASFVGERVSIVQLDFSDNQILALSLEPNIKVYWSLLGAATWRPLSQLPPADRDRVVGRLTTRAELRMKNGVYANASSRWQIDANGTLRYAADATGAWQTVASGTSSKLAAIAFADSQRGWAVGDAGTILHSDDGGQTWRPQSGGEEALAARRAGLENRIYPAPWTWLALLLGAGLMAGGARRIKLPGANVAQPAGIAGLFVSDQPLKPGDTDHLGHGRIARGLADFIRNRNTEPGLTLAVTGSWGSGKSSIMRLLEDDLKRAGFRPAWFNAWHHQQEGRQLASMFNTIRKQAVPSIHTPAAWRVRAMLYWNRGWLYRLLALGVLGLFLLGLFEAQDKQAPLSQLRQAVVGAVMDVRPVVITSSSLEKLKQGGVLQPPTLATLTSHMVWQPRAQAGEGCRESNGDCRFDDLDQLYASLNQVLTPVRLTDEEKLALAEAAQHLGDQPRTMLGILLGALIIPLVLGKGLAVYGFHYLDFIKRLLPERGKVEGKEAVGTMENFRTEFCNLTQALDGRLVLFIDDLDRCNCDTVNEVLELVNYLVSVGQCFVVLGMAMEHVACCIEPKSPQQATDGYAIQYLKKLVNIEVPVPEANLNDIRAMLEGQARINERPVDGAPARRWAARALSLALLVALTWGMNRTWSQWHLEAQPKRFPSTATATTPTTDEPGAVRQAPTPPPQNQADTGAKARGPIGLLPAAGTETGAWAAGLSLLALAALAGGIAWPTRMRWLAWLHRRGILRAIRIGLGGAERKRDTPAFRAALEGWHQVIVAGDPTPRGIKRFVNRVRFLAMMEQALEEQEQIPEGVLVGLAALHHARVDVPGKGFQMNKAGMTEFMKDLGSTHWGMLLPEGTRGAIRTAIQNAPDWPPTPQQIERFQHMVEHMHVR